MPVRITNEALATKLDMVLENLKEHREEFKQHVVKDELIAKTVVLLEQTDSNRTWHIRSLWTAVVTGVIAFIFSHYK